MKKLFLCSIAAIITLLLFAETVFAAAPDTPVISSPADSSIHEGGAFINFTGTCSDDDDGELTGDALVWTSSKDGELGTGQAISIDTLQSGDHEIILTATDNDNNSSAASIDITVENNAPSSVITSPSDGSSFVSGSSVSFTGTGTDIDTGDTLTYSWESTIDATTTVIGASQVIAVSDLAVGTHVITLYVSDGDDTTGSTPITIEITNNAPTATLLSPSDNDTFYPGDTINFNGTGVDTEDDSGVLVYNWSCSEHGELDTVASFTDSSLDEGYHTITFTVTDTEGAVNEDEQSVTIYVGNNDPVATITSPSDGTSFDMDDVIIFQGTGTDTEDGTLSGSSLVWTSDLDGTLGEGTDLTSDALSSGTHVITLTATDSYSTPGTGTDTIIISVNNTFPTVEISNPSDNSTYYEGVDVTFSGSGSDAEDGILSGASLTWTSSLDGTLGTGSPLVLDSLSAGTHAITLTATDSEGASTISTAITVTIGNADPVASITAPADGSIYNRFDEITFYGTGTDSEDGSLTGASLSWSSSLDGGIGTGTIVPIESLTTGAHTITLTVTDSQSGTDTEAITIIVNNNSPAVTINDPPDNSVYDSGAEITFTGVAEDAEDGFLTGALLVWESSIDGPLGTGASLPKTLTDGTHIITLTATDSEAETGSASITVNVGNTPPTVSITEPATGANFDTGEFISFKGTGEDTEDGTLSGSSLQWTSSIDGDFATGSDPSRISTLSTGQHEIILIATDSDGAVTNSESISIRVGNTDPVATILNPADNDSFENGETITFEGTGIDDEDGILLTTSLVWTSTREGEIGTGTSFSTSSLSSGEHTITLTATDTDGASHSTSITIFAQNATPVVSITSPATGTSFDEGNSITFQGTATDTEDGTLSGESLVWTSNFDGEMGTGTSLDLDSLSSGTHTITLTATDSLTATGSATITVTIIPMTLSATALTLATGETETITISGGKSPYRAATRRSQIALPAENNGTVSITGISEGATVITITDNNKNSAEVYVTVTDGSGIGGVEFPDAYAGPDQTGIDENETVYLTGSNANITSTGTVSFLWVQTDPSDPTEVLAEPTVELSDASSDSPWFIAPLVDLNGQTLTFQLTVTNQTGADTDIVQITLNDNGITEFPAGTATFQSTTGENMGAETLGSSVLKRLNTVDPSDLNTSTLPQSIIYGLIDMKVEAPVAGATISLVVYFPEAVPADYSWFKYIESEDTWVDFDRELISSGTGDGAEFSEDRTYVTLYITDDGRYDDNKEDLIVEDPSGLGKAPVKDISGSFSSGSDDDSFGCFIEACQD